MKQANCKAENLNTMILLTLVLHFVNNLFDRNSLTKRKGVLTLKTAKEHCLILLILYSITQIAYLYRIKVEL